MFLAGSDEAVDRRSCHEFEESDCHLNRYGELCMHIFLFEYHFTWNAISHHQIIDQMASETQSITAVIIALMNTESGFHVPDFPVTTRREEMCINRNTHFVCSQNAFGSS
jgi:hypothetical protein